MGVPGEIVVGGRGLRRRPIALGAGAAALALLAYLHAPLPAPAVAAPAPGDCVELHLYSNGFHTDIAAPADLFPADHPLRRLYPDASSFLIGWGEEAFYRADTFNALRALDALAPPSPSVLHVAYNAPAASAYLGPTDDTGVAVSRAGAADFVAFVDRSLALGADGQPIRVADGKVVGRSAFLRSRGSFHLFNVCNQWMARALRAAGVDVNARGAWMGDGLIRQVRAAGRASCPA